MNMKMLRDQQSNHAAASPRTGVTNPTSTAPEYFMDESSELEEKIFTEKPAPRIPESPDEESFRMFLKTNLPRHKASQALLERIRSSIQHEK